MTKRKEEILIFLCF